MDKLGDQTIQTDKILKNFHWSWISEVLDGMDKTQMATKGSCAH